MAEQEGKVERLKEAGMPVEALNEKLVQQLERLDDDEVKALVEIRRKLNRDLDADLESAVDSVGVIVW